MNSSAPEAAQKEKALLRKAFELINGRVFVVMADR